VSHLGERITALVDGELDHDARDRALAHLATCGQCRAEADAQRRLKRRLRSLNEATPSSNLLTRLYAMGEPGGPIPPRARPMPGGARAPFVPRPGAGHPRDNRPPGTPLMRRRVPRMRYLAVGAATLAVFGVGAAGFAAGADTGQLPRVGPAVEQFAVEHALTSGDVPVSDNDPAVSSQPSDGGPPPASKPAQQP
jgi:anti-sigma factor RsiW